LEEMAQARGGIVTKPELIRFGDATEAYPLPAEISNKIKAMIHGSIGDMTVKIPSEEIDKVVKKIRIRKKQ